jgi:hypothetical protein
MLRSFAVTVALVAVATPAGAQVPDHLKCYKMKDALTLVGTADLDTPQLGVDPGCKIMKASLFCVPGTKTNVAVTNKATKQPITPLPVEGGASGARPDDRICYKVKCPTTVAIADQPVTDQFGSRTVSKLKASLVCTPAFKGTARFVDNGNSITDNYTGLQWVKTNNGDNDPDFANPQDADNYYDWEADSGCLFAGCRNGRVFTDYLSRLNFCTSTDGNTQLFAGFAGHCDWRLPTPAELQTILSAPFPCGSPCIDPIFGPIAWSGGATEGQPYYWSSTTVDGSPGQVWIVAFGDGSVHNITKGTTGYVRAVRGGSAE